MRTVPMKAASHDLDVLAELRLLPALAEVAPDTLAELAKLVVQRRVHAQNLLVEQAVASQELLVLARGAAKVVRKPPAGTDDEVIVLDVMRAPALVADPSIIDGRQAFASVVTLRSSHVLAVPRRSLLKMLLTHPTLVRALLARFTEEVRAEVRRVDEVVSGPVDERVKRVLEGLALQHGTLLGQGRFIAIPLRRRDIASMVNATTETVSRLLAKFEREGLLRSTRDGIWWRARPRPPSPAVVAQNDPAEDVATEATSATAAGSQDRRR